MPNGSICSCQSICGLRDRLLYQSGQLGCELGVAGEGYVKGAFGAQSQLYKQIKGLELKRAKSRKLKSKSVAGK